MTEKSYSLDMENEKERSFELIPKGYRRVEIVNFEKRISAEKFDDDGNKIGGGNPYFWWDLKLVDDWRHLFVNTTAMKGKRWSLKQALQSVGIEKNKKTGMYDFDIEYIISTEDNPKIIVVYIDHKPNKYMGKTEMRENVTEFLSEEAYAEKLEKEKIRKKEETEVKDDEPYKNQFD